MNDATHTATGVIRRASTESAQGPHGPSTLPDDLVIRSAKRLRALALLYAFVFFMSTFFPAVYSAEGFGSGSFYLWGISAIGHAVGGKNVAAGSWLCVFVLLAIAEWWMRRVTRQKKEGRHEQHGCTWAAIRLVPRADGRTGLTTSPVFFVLRFVSSHREYTSCFPSANLSPRSSYAA